MSAKARAAFVRAQAKINLFLRVGGRNTDGYHDLLTLFQRIDLADDVVVRVETATREVRCSGPVLPAQGLGPAEQNLAYRAAAAYAEHAGWPDGFDIEITKRIPVGGGLGGGSADAAATLRALDTLAPRPVGEEALFQIARTLGADVAFLTTSLVTSVAGGRGDLLYPSELPRPLSPRNVVLLIPPFSVATGDAYGWLDSDRPNAPDPAFRMTSTGDPWDVVERAAAKYGNDFEAPVEKRHPELADWRLRLDQLGARIARLSGSGSTVFGVFDGRPPADASLPSAVQIVRTQTSARVVQVEAQK